MKSDQVAPSVPVYIHSCGFNSALGSTLQEVASTFAQGYSDYMIPVSDRLTDGTDTVVGRAQGPLPEITDHLNHHQTYNNQLALSALLNIKASVDTAIKRYGRDRVAVVVGTSTSGISDGEEALAYQMKEGAFAADFHYQKQEVGNLSEFVAAYLGTEGPTYTLSTACSSSGRAFISAKRLLKAGIVDAVVVGGADSLCQLTLNGFHGLGALSSSLCNPFSANRNGINIGEAAAFMLLSLDPSEDESLIALLGVGESSDAYHLSAPNPDGSGAEISIRGALNDAGLTPDEIGYVNAHGTGTPLNDSMEAKVINRVFGAETPVSSTKPFTGHALGAASILEASICWIVLKYGLDLPPQINDGEISPDLDAIHLVTPNMELRKSAILSNSFAFGGNNVSLIFGAYNG